MVRINVLNPTGVDVQTPAERDAGQVDVGVQKDLEIKIKPTVGVKINDSKKTKKEKLNFKKAINGDIMIFDHKDIDIVMMPEKNKVVAFPKESMGAHVYEVQNRLFKFLFNKGVIILDSVQGGNVFSSMEAKLAESKDYNVVQTTLLTIGKFIEDEKPLYEFEKAFEEEEERRLLEPGPEDSTEFDPEKYHSDEKGSMRDTKAFGIANIYRL